MAINPEFITCVICGESDASPFDFRKTPAELAELEAIHARRMEQSARGWTGPQYISHPTRALLCDDHHAQARALKLSELPISDGLAKLRAAS